MSNDHKDLLSALSEIANSSIDHDGGDGHFLVKLTPQQAYSKGIEAGRVLQARDLVQTYFPLGDEDFNRALNVAGLPLIRDTGEH